MFRGKANFINVLAAIALVVFSNTSAQAGRLSCPDVQATVTAEDDALARQVCEAAARSIERLTACRLRQTAPVHISVLPKIENSRPECMGRFLCHDGRVELLAPQTIKSALPPESPFAQLDAHAFFDSLVTHEITHALIFQTLGGTAGSVAQNEYIAYAMQLDALPAKDREKLVAPYREEGEVTLTELNGFILSMKPARFAARAWLHFRAPENGCHFLGLILDGEVSFGLSFP
jgi:hypothetical protein